MAALLALTTGAQAQPESMASIFSNANNGDRPMVIPRRSSVIIIACHGLGFGDLSCYGQTNFQTPNIDRLAAEGTRFTDYRVTSDDLPTAEAVLMAGNSKGTGATQHSLAARMLDAGYHTKLVGEWTLGTPWTQGFEEFGGYLSEAEAKNYYSDYVYRYVPQAIYDPTNHTQGTFNDREEIYDNTGNKKGKFVPDQLMTAVANFARVCRPSFANHYQPFFFLVELPAPETVTPGKDDYPVPTDAPYSGESWPQAAKNRAALMTRLDNNVGHLLEQLSKLGMTNNVAIFLTGSVAPEKFANTNLNFLTLKGEVRGGKSADRFKVPMIVRWPEHVPAGKVSRAPWSIVDLAPTVMEIGYARTDANITGISVLPILMGEPGTNTLTVPDRIQR